MTAPPRLTQAGNRFANGRLAEIHESEKLRREIEALRHELADTRQQQRTKQCGGSLLGLGIAFLLGVSLGDD